MPWQCAIPLSLRALMKGIMEMRRILALVLLSVALMVCVVPTIHAESDAAQFSAQGITQVSFIEGPRSPHERFVKSNSGVLADKHLKLEWFVGPKKDTTWDEAESWVESLTVEGDGWRMPTREELRSLYQEKALSNHICPVYRTCCRFVWTGEKSRFDACVGLLLCQRQ